MSVLRSRPVLRWLVPAAAAVAVIGGGAAVGTIAAERRPDAATAQRGPAAGRSADRPAGRAVRHRRAARRPRPAAAAGLGSAGTELTTLLTGTHTLRVWYSGPDKAAGRPAGHAGRERRDPQRHGRVDLAEPEQHRHPPHAAGDAGRTPAARRRRRPCRPTPQQAADLALAAIDPSTEVSVGRSAKVAGRDAYELVLAPRDTARWSARCGSPSTPSEHVPLRVRGVRRRAATGRRSRWPSPRSSFRRPDAEQFTFNPPPGVKVTEEKAERPAAGRGCRQAWPRRTAG